MVVIDDQSEIRLFKTPTTPEDRSLGVIEGFELAAAGYGLSLADFCGRVAYFAHGTTAATNALIERTGETTGLITTRGTGDAILMQRGMGSWTGIGNITGHYSQRINPVPIVAKRNIVEVDERLDYEGDEIVPLNHDQVRVAARLLREQGCKALAICFLWSFVRPDHERAAAAAVREEWPEAFLTLSSDIAPVIGEYERTATTVINSYLGPVISRYVELLEKRLRQNGFTGDMAIMDSAGGVMKAKEAAERAVGMLTSGPAGGVLASAALAKRLGYPNVITGDMGGTSFDAGLIVDGEPLVETTSIVGRYHLAAPRIRVTAIGSGGGSIARVDESGLLTVGPESAGAVPGPACYGQGGERPTVTDADVVLGVIDPTYFLGGRIPLYRDKAEAAIRTYIAEPLGMTVDQAAAGIRSVADNQMADLLRTVTVQQGHDPRDFVLFAYGGAGPTHAYAFTQESGIGTIVVPHTATVHSGYGAVSSDRYRSFQLSDSQRTLPHTRRVSDQLDVARITSRFRELEQRCLGAMEHPQLRMNRILYFRYRRQTHELPIPVPDGELTPELVDQLAAEFHERYERIYGKGTSLSDAGIEINTFRLEGRIPSPADTDEGVRSGGKQGSLEAAALGSRQVIFGRNRAAAAVYRGEDVPADSHLHGPAILEYPGTTVVIGPGQEGHLTAEGNIIINLNTAATAAVFGEAAQPAHAR